MPKAWPSRKFHKKEDLYFISFVTPDIGMDRYYGERAIFLYRN